MIVLYHNGARAVKVISNENKILTCNKNAKLSIVLSQLAFQYPGSKIIWCNEKLESNLNLETINTIFHHDKMMLSYNPEGTEFLGRKIGYIDDSPFIKIKKEVSYPTWQMSSLVGAIHASVLVEIDKKIKLDSDFDYYLTSIAKLCMPLGLLCYSQPKLLFETKIRLISKPSNLILFRFVKQHYKTRWIFLLFLNLMISEFKFPLLSLLSSFTFKNRNNNNINLDSIKVNSSLQGTNSETIDVIIPTIGRKQYLYDVLKDLSQQTHLPKNVIIVEQNPLIESVSELDYLTSEDWPFVIKHTFTHQAGACNARNVALNQVESEWLFFADDDIRIENLFIESAFDLISKYKNKAATFNCLQVNEKSAYKEIFQWSTFGSGCSIVKSEVVEKLRFDTKYEFGFGEDSDFGMQIRNRGCDILYFPVPLILHLKAPIGGFRIKPDLVWNNLKIKPKPSPTVSLYKILNQTKEQQKGYQIVLFFKYYKKQSIKNPVRYFFNFKKQWKQSLYWANELIRKSE